MKRAKQKKLTTLAKTRKIIFSKKKAALLKDVLLKVIIDETIN